MLYNIIIFAGAVQLARWLYALTVCLLRCIDGSKDAMSQKSDARRRCHEMLDRLGDPALEAHAYQFLQYLYIYGDKKPAPGAANTEGGEVDGRDVNVD